MTYITRSRFHNVSFSGGNGGVVGTWSSITCSSALCDALLSDVIVTSSAFHDCSVWSDDIGASGSGGAVYIRDGSTTIDNTSFAGSAATLFGGALATVSFSRAVVSTSNFTDNEAMFGGRFVDSHSAHDSPLYAPHLVLFCWSLSQPCWF